MNVTEFNKSLESNQTKPVYLFDGVEVNLFNRSEKKLKAAAVSPAMEAFNFTKYSQKDFDINEILASCQTLPVLSEKRMVVVDETTKFLDTTDNTVLDSLEAYLKDPSPSTVLLIRSIKGDKRRKIYKLLKKYGEIVDFKKLDRRMLTAFINQVLSEQKITMDNRTKSLFIDRTHYLDNEDIDTFTIENYLKQLANFADEDGKIDSEMVMEVVPEGVEDNVYKIIDNALAGNMKNVNEILEYFFLHGQSAIGLFGLLLYQLRNIFKVKILIERGYSQNNIAKETKLSPFIIRKTTGLARHFSVKFLRQLFSEAADIDYKVKTGQLEAEFALEYFLLKLARNRQKGH